MSHNDDSPEDSDTRPSASHRAADGAVPDGAANTSGEQSPRPPGLRDVGTGEEGVPASTGEAPSKPSSLPDEAWDDEIDRMRRGEWGDTYFSDEDLAQMSSEFQLNENGKARYVGLPPESFSERRHPALPPEAIRLVAESLAQEHGYGSLEALLSCLPKGRPTAAQAKHLDAAAKIVSHLRTAPSGANSRLVVVGGPHASGFEPVATQEGIAKALGISKRAVQNLERRAQR